MYDVLARQLQAVVIAAGGFSCSTGDRPLASRPACQQILAGFLQLGACGLGYVLGDPPRQSQLVVGGVHNGRCRLLGQVPLHNLQQQAQGLPS